jgi:thioredoxin-related protein
MKNLILTLAAIFLLTVSLSAQTIQWHSIDEAATLAKAQHKKIFVKVYTTWCGWCREMDKSVLTDAYLAKYINDNYIAVKFDAEQKNSVSWNGETYKLVKTANGSYHELASSWLKGKMGYPTLVFLESNGNVIQAIQGYRKAPELERISTYFATNEHLNTPWETFERDYHRP